MVRFAGGLQPVTPGGAGEFHIANLPESAHRVMVSGVAPTHYVKEIQYNGSVVPDRIVPLDRPAIRT